MHITNRMKKTIVLPVIALGIFAMTTAARAETWAIDPMHSNISFSVQHLVISKVRGQFNKFSGSISATGTDPSSVKIEATIDATSINTNQAKRDGHLMSPDFLDVAKYPTITFKSTRIEAAGDGKWKVIGNLTLHGVTKEVALDVSGPSPEIKDPMGNARRGASATITINRQDYGVAFNKTLDSGGLVAGNEVSISIDVEAVKKP
jgi:polyisoprenoid-binding protein YceI